MNTVTDSFAELSGISKQNCASHCIAGRCVITGDHVCSHPCMSGLQQPGRQPPEVLKRYGEACQILGVKNKFEVTP
jgi:hypothetical protein